MKITFRHTHEARPGPGVCGNFSQKPPTTGPSLDKIHPVSASPRRRRPCIGSRMVQNADEKDERTHCESTSFVIQIITYRLILTGNYKVEAHPGIYHRQLIKKDQDIPRTPAQTRNERIKHEHDVVINMTYYIRPCVRLDSCVLSTRCRILEACVTITQTQPHTHKMTYPPLARI